MYTIDQRFLLPLAALAVGCGPACLVPWYADADGDGYGDRGDLVESCSAPKGYVDDADDCNDRDAQVHPDRADVCNGIDDDCDGILDPEAREWFADIDDDGVGGAFTTIACDAPDGYVADVGDCDDGDPTVYPGAVEVCDGRDQDCDTLVDEGAGGGTRWYPDDDRDGWGANAGGRDLCAPPAHWVTVSGDCDDTEPLLNPSQVETCNGYDDDCDGYTDIHDPEGVADLVWVYLDDDDDGYGAGLATASCGVPSGYSLVAADCDDTDALVSPSADEVCGGGDEDCDGFVDLDDLSVDSSTLVEGWADEDRDGLGDPDAPAVDCALGGRVVGNERDCDDTTTRIGTDDWLGDGDGDGAGTGTAVAGEDCLPPSPGMVNVAAPTDCDDQDPTIHALAPDPCGDGVDQDCTGVDPACTGPLAGIVAIGDVGRAWIDGGPNIDRLGIVGAGADFDGDGFRDVTVGSPGAEGAGVLQILAGPPPEGSAPWEARTRIVGTELAGELGAAAAAIDDVSSDGLPDLLVGAPEAGSTGEAYVYTGSDAFLSPRWTLLGGTVGDEAGASVALVGDDGDGGIQVLVGAPGRDDVALATVGIGTSNFTASRVLLEGSGRLGEQVACCTDLAAGGSANLVLGAPDESSTAFNAGAVWLVDSVQDDGQWDVDLVRSAVFRGAPGGHLGRALATDGDIDGDGARDVVAAAPNDPTGGQDAGKVYGFTTGAGGDANAVATWIVEGDFAGMVLAQSIAIGDIDADGVDDVALGAGYVDIGGADGGAVYVFFGPSIGTDGAGDADLVLYGPVETEAGVSLVLGEIDVDPGADLWIGMPGVAPGAAWLIPGP